MIFEVFLDTVLALTFAKLLLLACLHRLSLSLSLAVANTTSVNHLTMFLGPIQFVGPASGSINHTLLLELGAQV